MDANPDSPRTAAPIVTQEIRIVDAQGRVRMRLSAGTDGPSIALTREDGATAATLAVDAKGAHVKFDGPGKSTGYVFLNNAGASGLVLVDTRGQRRLEAMVDARGAARVETFDDEGRPSPAAST